MSMQNNESIFDPRQEAQILYLSAIEYIAEGNNEDGSGWINETACAKAVPVLEMALSLDPGNPLIREHLGSALKGAGKNDAALYHLKKVVRENPDTSMARLSAINLLVKLGHHAEALPMAEEGTKRNPDGTIFWYLHAHCCMVTRRYEDALKSAKQALAVITMEEKFSQPDLETSITRMAHQARQGIRSQATMKNTPPPQP